ncbi:hypothetical protein NDU88_002731 [Pleurodeles waltl]|uniref:Uncharacterized protein n=1 Tax=Pleurodeles waltl TaxID=8319 RepID=A0AAV7WQB7_PLEWA|nr:hypothetical protein NDU88_002731 [Pleurodeles waltl]
MGHFAKVCSKKLNKGDKKTVKCVMENEDEGDGENESLGDEGVLLIEDAVCLGEAVLDVCANLKKKLFRDITIGVGDDEWEEFSVAVIRDSKDAITKEEWEAEYGKDVMLSRACHSCARNVDWWLLLQLVHATVGIVLKCMQKVNPGGSYMVPSESPQFYPVQYVI